jgi:hypothetical protein
MNDAKLMKMRDLKEKIPCRHGIRVGAVHKLADMH